MRRSQPLSWLYDDLLAWLCPGGALLTALALRFPDVVRDLRALAPELTLPTWLAGAYALGLALSPLGRLVYGVAQAIVWPRLRAAWAPALRFLADRLARSEGLHLPDAAVMSTHVFHDVDRRLREYIEAVDPGSSTVLLRMKVLCSLSCNAVAACVVFAVVDAFAGTPAAWTASQVALWSAVTTLAFVAAVYRERRRQRTELSVWRRLQVRVDEPVPRAEPQLVRK